MAYGVGSTVGCEGGCEGVNVKVRLSVGSNVGCSCGCEGVGVKRCQLNQVSNPPEAKIPVVMTLVGENKTLLKEGLFKGGKLSTTIFMRYG